MINRTMVLAAMVAASVWAAFWIYFALASAWSEPGTVLTKLTISVIAVAVLAGSVLVTLANPCVGGAVLVLEGLALVVANYTFLQNPPSTQVFLLVTLALPPLLAGCLLLANSRPRSATG